MIEDDDWKDVVVHSMTAVGIRAAILVQLSSLFLITSSLLADVVIRDQAAQTAVSYQRSYALLIGVSDYTAGWRDLPSIPGELSQVEAVLEKKHDFEVTKLLDPTERELMRAIELFIDKYGYHSQNRLLIFYAGHGYSRDLGTGPRGYLVPADTPRPTEDLDGFRAKAVPMTQVETWARNIEAKHALFVFDSCFSGTIFQTRSELPQPLTVTKKIGRNARQFLTSGSAGEEVPAKSVFTPAFVRALEGEADLVRDGYVTATELGVFLDQKVRYPGQTPQFGSLAGYHEGDFVFRIDSKGAALQIPDWAGLRERMARDLAALKALDVSDATANDKELAWREFQRTYGDDIPWTDEDEQARAYAAERELYWRRQANPVLEIRDEASQKMLDKLLGRNGSSDQIGGTR